MTTQEVTTTEAEKAVTVTVKHWINGAETEGTSGRTQPIYNPATGEVSAQLVLGDATTVDEAVRVAAQAQKSWGRVSLAKRTGILFRMRELMVAHELEIAEIISAEHGKTVEDARGEIARGRESIEFACGINQASKGDFSAEASTGVDVHNLRQPLGVVAGITPFNFPAMVPLWMHPVAIATGNAFILKPSERDPSASLLVAKLYQEAGLPDGVFNVVHGGKETVDALLEHPGISAVSFVGSTPIARYVQQNAIANGKRVQALGGANNHAVVMPDADIDFAASQISSGAFGSAGERCMAVPVAVAVGEAAEPLIAALKKEAEKIKVGPGNATDTDMGPVITPAARQRVLDFTTSAIEGGAMAVVDGRGLKVEGHENGFFVGPTILDNVSSRHARILRRGLWSPPGDYAGRYLRGGPQTSQLLALRQRFGDLHQLGRVRQSLLSRGRGRDGRRQRADPGPRGLLLLRRLEGLPLRRPPRTRSRGGPLLHPRESRHDPVASPGDSGELKHELSS